MAAYLLCLGLRAATEHLIGHGFLYMFTSIQKKEKHLMRKNGKGQQDSREKVSLWILARPRGDVRGCVAAGWI